MSTSGGKGSESQAVTARPQRVASGGVARGSVRPPSSKSLTHRYFDLALIGRLPLIVHRPLDAQDTRLFAQLLAEVGFGVKWRQERVTLTPPTAQSSSADGEPVPLYCGNAGTLVRLVTAALAAVPGRWQVDGTPRMRQRPLGPLLAGLREWGVGIQEAGEAGRLPVIVEGGELSGGATRIDAGESSQYLSALLLAALGARGETTIEVAALTSSPYVDLTLAVAREMGGRIEKRGTVYRVWPGLAPPAAVEVEGDWSAACYPATAAALTGGRVRLTGMKADSAQGDRRFLELLEEMGARVLVEEGAILVEGGGSLRALDADLSTMPDQVPTLAALAPFAHGTTRIRGVPHLRIKESDRLRAMATELQRVGAEAVEHDDGLEIAGIWADREPPASAVSVDSWDDHRIAMSMALVGLRRPELTVEEPGVVAKSYPDFWRDLDRLLAVG